MFFDSIPKVVSHIESLEKEEKYLLLFELLEREIIDFNDFNSAYLEKIKIEKKNAEDLLSKCFLNLGYLSINKNTPAAKEVRKFLFDKNVWSGTDGSDFGKLLETEFKK